MKFVLGKFNKFNSNVCEFKRLAFLYKTLSGFWNISNHFLWHGSTPLIKVCIIFEVCREICLCLILHCFSFNFRIGFCLNVFPYCWTILQFFLLWSWPSLFDKWMNEFCLFHNKTGSEYINTVDMNIISAAKDFANGHFYLGQWIYQPSFQRIQRLNVWSYFPF